MEHRPGGDSGQRTPPLDQAALLGLLSALLNLDVRVIAVVPRAGEAGEAPP